MSEHYIPPGAEGLADSLGLEPIVTGTEGLADLLGLESEPAVNASPPNAAHDPFTGLPPEPGPITLDFDKGYFTVTLSRARAATIGPNSVNEMMHAWGLDFSSGRSSPECAVLFWPKEAGTDQAAMFAAQVAEHVTEAARTALGQEAQAAETVEPLSPDAPAPVHLTADQDVRLIALGYQPVVVNGKRPVTDGWQAGEMAPARMAADRAAHPLARNTGIRTGPVVGDDVDVLDAAHAAKLRDIGNAIMGQSADVRVGAKGSLTVYRTLTPMPKIAIRQKTEIDGKPAVRTLVEILGKGQQFVAYGMHPEANRPYTWPNAGYHPLARPLHSLVLVTPLQIRECMQARFDHLAATGQYPGLYLTGADSSEWTKARSSAGTEPIWEQDFVGVLGYVDCDSDRDKWIRDLASIRSAVVQRRTPHGVEPLTDNELYEHALAWSQGLYDHAHRYDKEEPSSYLGANSVDSLTGDESVEHNFWSLRPAKKGGRDRTIASLIQEAQRNGYHGPKNVHDSAEQRPDPSETFSPYAERAASGEEHKGDTRASGASGTANSGNHDGLIVITGADIKPKKLQWLWRGWIARSVLTMAAGPPETGKTSCAISFAATITVGGKWPDGTLAEQGEVILWLGEDLAEETVATRFIACGGDRNRLHIVKGVREGEATRPFDPAEDMQKLYDYATAKTPNLRLIVIEPIVIVVRGDSHKNAETRKGLHKVVALAETLQVAVVGITHYSKGTQGKLPLERVTGSLAFGAAPRTVLGFVMSPDGSKRRMVKTKTNIGAGGGGFDYALSRVPVALGDGETEEGQRVEWGAAVFGSAGKLVSQIEGDGEQEPAAPLNATMWLRELLGGGEVEVKHIKTAVTASEYSWRTIVRAKTELGVSSEQRGWGEDHWWVWKLPEPPAAPDAEAVPF